MTSRTDLEGTVTGRQALAESRDDRAASIKALRDLEEMACAPGPSRLEAWRDDVLSALDKLAAHLQHQYQTSLEDDSLLSQLAADAPHLKASVDSLRARQGDLIEDLDLLSRRLGDFGRTPDVGSLRSHLARLTAEIRELRAWESDLVHEAYFVDLGEGG